MQTFNLTRKDLPAFGFLPHIKFNIDDIVLHCQNEKILDPKIYTDIQVSAHSDHESFVRLNSFHKNRFFVEDEGQLLEGEKYRQLYLTNIRPDLKGLPVKVAHNESAKIRYRRLDPKSPLYDPLVDELNYTSRNQFATGIFGKILDCFADQVTRVRLAYLAPGFSIKPHIDHDPSYIVRYHIPILTNNQCRMNIKIKDVILDTWFPADGRVYFLNAGLTHWASNQSEQWRLHLIVDVHGQRDLKNVIEYAGP